MLRDLQDHKKTDPIITLFSLIALEKFAQISKRNLTVKAASHEAIVIDDIIFQLKTKF